MTGLTFSSDGTRLIGVTNDRACVRVWALRLLRAGLRELGLDWDTPPYPLAAGDQPDRELLDIELIGCETLKKSAGKPAK